MRQSAPRAAWRAAVAMCAALVLAACASAPPGPTTPGIVPVPPASIALDTAFRAEGRMSARRGDEGVAVHYDWRHAPDRDEFDVATPLGQVVARMQRDAAGVRVERPGEPTVGYASWRALTEAVLGVPIPVEGLVSWVQGAPAAAAAVDVERDAAGRATLLREQGWEIVYSYADPAARRPSRLVMRYPGNEAIEVRIVVDRWSTPS